MVGTKRGERERDGVMEVLNHIKIISTLLACPKSLSMMVSHVELPFLRILVLLWIHLSLMNGAHYLAARLTKVATIQSTSELTMAIPAAKRY